MTVRSILGLLLGVLVAAPASAYYRPFATSGLGAAALVRGVAAGDLDGDGDADLVVALASGGPRVYRNDTGSFSQVASVSYSQANDVWLADDDGDGDLDLFFVAQNSLLRAANEGGLSFGNASLFSSASPGASLVAGDVDGDGDDDLFVAIYAGSTVVIRQLSAGGGIVTLDSQSVGAAPPANALALADLDEDGALDLVSGVAGVRWFSSVTGAKHTISATSSPIAIADMNGDGHLDVVASGTIHRHSGAVAPATPAWSAVSGSPSGLQFAPFDGEGDGDADLFYATGSQMGWSEQLTPTSWSAHAFSLGIDGFVAFDFEGDGDVDVASYRETSGTLYLHRNQQTTRWITAAPSGTQGRGELATLAGAIQDFNATAQTLGLADETTPPIVENDQLGPTLTFHADDIGACHGFRIVAHQPGANLVFDDQEGSGWWDDAISIGDIDNHENDDFSFYFSLDPGAPPVYGFGVFLLDNITDSSEWMRIYDANGQIINQLDHHHIVDSSGDQTSYVGFWSSEPISRIHFNEGTSGDDIGIKFFTFATGADTDGDGLRDCDEQSLGTSWDDPDSDGDTLSDGDEENVYGSDPLDVDSDDDGLDDGYEVAHGFDPTVGGDGTADPDLDDLDNLGEQAAGTDPNDADSDDDGLLDGEELSATATDPLDADSDDDSLSDGDEVNLHGSDPNVVDSDGDGAGDGVEVGFATNPTHPDSDRDGLCDFGLPTPGVCFGGYEDLDLDGVVDAGETSALTVDSDSDGLFDRAEARALGSDPSLADSDADGTSDAADNCRLVANPEQLDVDGDGRGDACDYRAPLDLSDTTPRQVAVQWEHAGDPAQLGLAFDHLALPASYSASGSQRTITIAAADFEAWHTQISPLAIDPGSASDYVITLDAGSGELLFASWSFAASGVAYTASAASGTTGGFSTDPAWPGEAFFCPDPPGGCDATITAQPFHATTGAVSGLGGIQAPALYGAAELLFTPDLRLAELPDPPLTLGFEGVADPGEEVLFSPVYSESGFAFDGGFGADPDFHVLSASTPGAGVGGSDFGLVENDPAFTLASSGGRPFALERLQLAQAFGEPQGNVMVTGVRFGAAPVQAALPTLSNLYVIHEFGPEWSELASVHFASDSESLAIDEVEVVPSVVPEPVAGTGLAAGAVFLLALLRRRRRA